MHFTKMQGTGNDFVLIETPDIPRDWPALAKAMCDRHFGIGSDGLLLLLPSKQADFRMRMFNPDGSEAEACGNGLRCLARYLVVRKLVRPTATEVLLETRAGVRRFFLRRQGSEETQVQVSMGAPRFGPRDIPIALEPGKGGLLYINSLLNYKTRVDGLELSLNLVSMGNPHAVCFWKSASGGLADFPLSRIGPQVEHLAVFPERTNFEVVRVLGRREVEVRVWERGAGETLSCGSGACAVAVASQLLGHVDDVVDIKVSGGTLRVQWDGKGEVLLGGPAEIVFTGEWPD